MGIRRQIIYPLIFVAFLLIIAVAIPGQHPFLKVKWNLWTFRRVYRCRWCRWQLRLHWTRTGSCDTGYCQSFFTCLSG